MSLDFHPFVKPDNAQFITIPEIILKPSKIEKEKMSISESSSSASSIKSEDNKDMLRVARDIDLSKVKNVKTTGGNVYSLAELKTFARKLGISGPMNKEPLVKKIHDVVNLLRQKHNAKIEISDTSSE